MNNCQCDKKDCPLINNVIDEFVTLLKEHPMTSNYDWEYYDEIAQKLKQK